MIVPIRIGNAKTDRDHVKEGRLGQVGAHCAQVITGVETQLIVATHERRALEDWTVGAAVCIGMNGAEVDHATIEQIQIDLQIRRRLARSGVEYMRRQTAHVFQSSPACCPCEQLLRPLHLES